MALRKHNNKGLSGGNCSIVLQATQAKDGLQKYQPLILLIASVFDEIVDGGEEWINIGATRDKSTFIVSVGTGSRKMYASGANIDEVASECKNLID